MEFSRHACSCMAPEHSICRRSKRIVCYVQGTLNLGLQLFRSSLNKIVVYSDTDWGDSPNTRHSKSGFCLYLGDNRISWSSKRQPTMSHSSAKVEYKGIANAVAETCWIRNLLLELHCPIRSATIVYCDNISSVFISNNPVQHQRTKHIEIDIHFVREKVPMGQVKVMHVSFSSQYTYIFYEGLAKHTIRKL